DPDFTYPDTYKFNLTVTDNFGLSNTTATPVTITVTKTNPTVGTPFLTGPHGSTLYVGETAMLAVPVTNPDGGTLPYPSPQPNAANRAPVTFVPTATVATPTFVLPNPQCLATGSTGRCPTFKVIVTNSALPTAGSATSATSAAWTDSLFTRPVANAGPDQSKK